MNEGDEFTFVDDENLGPQPPRQTLLVLADS